MVQYPPMATPLLQGGRIIDLEQQIDHTGDVLVCDGEIVQLSDSPITDEDANVIDCDGFIVSPGLIDIHVHFREPCGDKHEETIATGSAAAANGGGTKITVALAPVSARTSSMVLNTGSVPSNFWPPFPGVQPATRLVP